MSQQELLTKVIATLGDHSIDHMVTGSVASSLQGEPRATHDLDVVVAIQETDIDLLVKAFPAPSYYLSAESIQEAISRKSMFNLIDVVDGDKVDFWILTDQPFDRSRFARKYVEEAMGIKLKVSSPEDTILAKLQWALQSGGSEKQYTDALRVFEVQHGNLDLGYVGSWAIRLGVDEMWQRLQEDADII